MTAMRRTLQDWYVRINSIYVDRNFYRSTESIFCHLIEVGRGLAIASSKKRKRKLNAEDFLPKTLAWWLALCGRVGVPNVEEMLWAKYPRVCPYCQLSRHQGDKCKEKQESRTEIRWDQLDILAKRDAERRPRSLTEWQTMFQAIYERGDTTDQELNITRLSEEFGELAEAIRVLPVAPSYFVSEAPDVFAWLMGFANQFAFDRSGPGDTLEEAMYRQYPDTCKDCGHSVCKCPPILVETLGRITQEAPITQVFPTHPGLFSSSEAIELFSDVERALVIGDREISISKNDVQMLARDLDKILGELTSHGAGQKFLSAQVAASLGRLEALAAQGAVTQESIQTLLEQIGSLPSEQRGALVGFLTSLSASALFQTILQVAPFFSGHS